MIKNYAIISQDRHRDHRVYLFIGTEEEVKTECEKVWRNDFSFDYEYPWVNSGGDYCVEYVEVSELEASEGN